MPKSDQVYRINEIVSIIYRDIGADLSAKRLADKAAYSEHYFHRLFKSVTGESVLQFIKRTRLEAAANQLIFARHKTVREIAETCGYLSLPSFTRTFKSVYLVTPGEWRSGKQYDNQHYFRADPVIDAAYKRLEKVILPVPKSCFWRNSRWLM